MPSVVKSLAASSSCAHNTLSARYYTTQSSKSAPLIAALPHRSVLQVSGPDARKFLKGLTCKDVDSLQGGYSGFLNASGRVLHTVFIFPQRDAKIPTYLISHDSPLTHPAPLADLLPPFRLRSKVRIKDVTEEWDVYSAWGGSLTGGPKRTWKIGSGGAAESAWSWEQVQSLGLDEGEVGCWDLRAGFGTQSMGCQLLTPKGIKPSLSPLHEQATASMYHLHRYILGVPEGSDEIVPGQALPLESCMDVHGGVDFRKGCYLGQELTVRTYHTGATRKRILPIRLFPLTPAGLSEPLSSLHNLPPSSHPIPGGSAADITYHPPLSSASQKARSAGRILKVHDTVTSVGLGLVRLEMAEKSWWGCNMSDEILKTATIGDWVNGGQGRLTTSIDGTNWGVFVGKGEAWGAAQHEIDSKQ